MIVRGVVELLRKIIIAVASIVIFSLTFALINYVPKAEQQSNAYYMSLFEIIFIYALYSAPVFILGGIPCSIIIDKINKKSKFTSKFGSYIFNFVLYVLAGVITTFIFGMILSKGSWYFNFMFLVLGSCASLLFYHISLLYKRGK
jgi:Na+/serine symporter